MPITFQNINGGGSIIMQNNTNSGNISFPTPPPPPTPLYSDFGQYIVGGVRQDTTYTPTNTLSIWLDVTSPVTLTSIKLIRIPPTNWSTVSASAANGYFSTGRPVTPGSSINGGSTLYDMFATSVVYTPSVVGERADTTSQYDIYEIKPYYGFINQFVTASLTVGQYNIQINTDPLFSVATLTNSIFPIDTTKSIYPSVTRGSFTTTHVAMEIY